MSTQELGTQELRISVAKLRPILEGPEQQGYLLLFDEFLDEHEFGLALHCVCDYLLEPQAPAPHPATVERIALLHSVMQIEDECLKSLHQKAELAG
jgi:hypothetical protein